MQCLLVDCHSVIFAWPELRKLHGRRTALAREAFIQLLTQYQDATGVHVVAVFDGAGPKPSEETLPGGIQIFYSAAGQTADAIIERLAAKYEGQHEITVATADHMVQTTALSFGANAISLEHLRMLLKDADTELQRMLKKSRRK